MDTEQQMQILSTLLVTCYSFMRQRDILDDFEKFAEKQGISSEMPTEEETLEEMPQNVPETGSTEATPKESTDSTAE